jgi:hypothetical protein
MNKSGANINRNAVFIFSLLYEILVAQWQKVLRLAGRYSTKSGGIMHLIPSSHNGHERSKAGISGHSCPEEPVEMTIVSRITGATRRVC